MNKLQDLQNVIMMGTYIHDNYQYSHMSNKTPQHNSVPQLGPNIRFFEYFMFLICLKLKFERSYKLLFILL